MNDKIQSGSTNALTQKDITDSVMMRVKELQDIGALVIPKNYAIGNELKMAFFEIQEVRNKEKRPALEVCTKDSIANALLQMVIEGLSVWRGQCSFVIYGNKLKCVREYNGAIALALRTGKIKDIPTAEIIYEGDKIEYEIKDGRKVNLRHTQTIENVIAGKMVGAYAVVPLTDGTPFIEIMTIQQIKQAWMMGDANGVSPAHRNFPDQMAKKTVINRALKLIINSSNDSYLFDDEDEEVVHESTELEEVEFTETKVIDKETNIDTPPPENVKKEEPSINFVNESDNMNDDYTPAIEITNDDDLNNSQILFQDEI